MRRVVLLVTLCSVILVPAGSWAEKAGTQPPVSLTNLLQQARDRVKAEPRTPLGTVTVERLPLGSPEPPAYLRALAPLPHLVAPMADLVERVLNDGMLPPAMKAAMGVRASQINGSPYVAAHLVRVLRGSERGQVVLSAFQSDALSRLRPAEQLAVRYADLLTRGVHGVTPEEFERVRGAFTDSEIVELTITTSFFNFFTRYAEALRLPVEPWVVDGVAPARPAGPRATTARVALLSDDEITAAAAALAASKDPAAQARGLGLGMANSQRAMLRAPALALAWRGFGSSFREKEQVGRDIKLQVSFAVSMVNGCRYCTIHQVVGLRRLGVDPGKLVAMKKDDTQLSARELVAVTFARKLTERPSGMSDDDYAPVKAEFGEAGALEVLLQTCTFAFMNRFTDGLLLPSEDEAVRIYQETYGSK